MSHVHVVGAGLAGLAAALSLSKAGHTVTVYEAGPAAGGRCRSYFDKDLDLRIDNGNHLMLSGNTAVCDYITETDAWDSITVHDQAALPFVDLRTFERWVVRPNQGRIPWWVLHPKRRVPQTRLSDYLQISAIARVHDDTTVADCMRRGRLFWHLLEPISIAVLNTPSQDGLARLLGTVMRETLLRGGGACRPMLPKQGLSETLVDPALATLRARGATIRTNHRVAEIAIADGAVVGMRGPDGLLPVGAGDSVVLAVPPWVASDLLPGLVAPDAFQAILNIHFRHEVAPKGAVAETGFIGLTSATAEWVFVKPGHVSVTISAANNLVDEPAQEIAERVWPNVVDALALDGPLKETLPPFRVVKEKRATFAATAAQDRRRPEARTAFAANLALAGDWTDTGLPATIEGAIRSGRVAAEVLLTRNQ
ncbi:MAG TPA: hydroxysqualene dehydroxylase HpnE [Rhodopila sp.]|nr:hydroxysqualene dehydroxylase HpnE [Rhodopila sp.]